MCCTVRRQESDPSPLKLDISGFSDDIDSNNESEQPRFTLAELRGVLNERNKLKMKLYEMEEELERVCPSSSRYDFRLYHCT